MTLVSLPFFVLLGLSVALYYLVPKRWQWVLLLLASLVFYSFSGIGGLVMMAVSALLSWGSARWMQSVTDGEAAQLAQAGDDRQQKRAIREQAKAKRRRILLPTALLLVGCLLVVRYSNQFFQFLGLSIGAQGGIAWLIPLGISYYTLMLLSYLVDVYRMKQAAARNPLKVLLFASFFLHITQGPIDRYGSLMPQMEAPHRPTYQQLTFGAQRMLWGIFKKAVIADNLAGLVALSFDAWQGSSAASLFLGSVLFSIQLYADFSGYMDMMIGAAGMFGLTLPENFQRPYFSRTMPEFWRRWHITLGDFFRDYVYYPVSVARPTLKLSGFVRGKFGQKAGRILSGVVPIYAVWFLTGLWHGPTGNYIAWGLYHGTLIVLSLIFTPMLSNWSKKLHIPVDSWWFHGFQMLRTFFLSCLGRVFFRAPDLAAALAIFRKMAGSLFSFSFLSNTGILAMPYSTNQRFTLFLFIPALLLVSILQERGTHIRESIARKKLPVRWLLFYALILAILLFGNYDMNRGSFIYAQF